ncbi:MAG TPA: ROK family protein [Phycisphaerales bacterium]|nr:ROK family protein [Phycisphaerales bacterium]
MATRPVIGIDLGGTNMQIGVVDAAGTGRVIGRAKKKTRAAEGFKAVLARMAEGVEEACKDAGIPVRTLAGIGIGAAGAVEPGTGVILQAPNLRWTNAPLARTLKQHTGRPVFVTNDVRAAIIGEHTHGAGKGATHLMAVWLGTGIGGGLILNNTVYPGFFNTAGEIGHICILPGGPPGGRSFENLCSRTAIADRIVRLIRTGRSSVVSRITDGDLSEIKARVIGEAFRKRDPLVCEVVDNAARSIGTTLAGLSSALSLQRIVIGGGLAEALGEPLVRAIRSAHHEAVYPHILRRTEIVRTKLEDDAGVVGAAVFAHRKGKLD